MVAVVVQKLTAVVHLTQLVVALDLAYLTHLKLKSVVRTMQELESLTAVVEKLTLVAVELTLVDFGKLVVQLVELDQNQIVIIELEVLPGSCRLLFDILILQHLLYHHQEHLLIQLVLQY